MVTNDALCWYEIKNYNFTSPTIKRLSDRTATIEKAVGIILQSSFYKMKQNLYKNYHGIGTYSSGSMMIFRGGKKQEYPAPFYKIGRFISKEQIDFNRYKIFWLWNPTYDLDSIVYGGTYRTTGKQKTFLQKNYNLFAQKRRYENESRKMFEKIFVSFDVTSVKRLVFYEVRNIKIKKNFLTFRYFEKNRNPRICNLKRKFLRWN